MFRYLLIECEDQEPAVKQDSKVREMYLTVMKTFSQVGHICINKKWGASFLGIRFWSIVELTDNLKVPNICYLMTTWEYQMFIYSFSVAEVKVGIGEWPCVVSRRGFGGRKYCAVCRHCMAFSKSNRRKSSKPSQFIID